MLQRHLSHSPVTQALALHWWEGLHDQTRPSQASAVCQPQMGLCELDIEAYIKEHYFNSPFGIERIQHPEDDAEWRWCLVGNIIDEHTYGVEKEISHGTKHFSPGAKVYCAMSMWSDGYDRIGVIGSPRHGRKHIEVIMESNRIENFRLQKCYNPAILKIMKQRHYGWWGNTDEDREEIKHYLSWLPNNNKTQEKEE